MSIPPFYLFQHCSADKGSIAQEGEEMEEITIEYREMVKKYCAFVNIKLDEALDGKSVMSYADKTELKITQGESSSVTRMNHRIDSVDLRNASHIKVGK